MAYAKQSRKWIRTFGGKITNTKLKV